jgi:aminoglycoside phosphotransferase (APT) family kinase protein
VPDPIATAAVLERFLRALHQVAPADAPRNPWRGVPLEARTAALHQHVEQLDGVVTRAAILALWNRALSAPKWPGPAVWIHGDLHPGNLLTSHDRLSGVIDFGDLTSGDPATDLSLLWMLPREVRSRFRGWTADHPEALQVRARAWAVALGLAYLAHSRDDAAMAALGEQTIDAALNEL